MANFIISWTLFWDDSVQEVQLRIHDGSWGGNQQHKQRLRFEANETVSTIQQKPTTEKLKMSVSFFSTTKDILQRELFLPGLPSESPSQPFRLFGKPKMATQVFITKCSFKLVARIIQTHVSVIHLLSLPDIIFPFIVYCFGLISQFISASFIQQWRHCASDLWLIYAEPS